jgi:hypothetical protein
VAVLELEAPRLLVAAEGTGGFKSDDVESAHDDASSGAGVLRPQGATSFLSQPGTPSFRRIPSISDDGPIRREAQLAQGHRGVHGAPIATVRYLPRFRPAVGPKRVAWPSLGGVKAVASMRVDVLEAGRREVGHVVARASLAHRTHTRHPPTSHCGAAGHAPREASCKPPPPCHIATLTSGDPTGSSRHRNPQNLPVRTRMPGGVASGRTQALPYAEQNDRHEPCNGEGRRPPPPD